MINRHNTLGKIWDGNDKSGALLPLFILLFVLSLPYRALVGIRNFLYDSSLLKSRKLPCPVISIGNITVGGTGKTPTAMLLARMLKEENYKSAILSRGYGRKNGHDVQIVSDGRNLLKTHHEAGDEPFYMAGMLPEIPVIVGASRYDAGRLAIERLGADVLVLDDGFQHRGLHRDLNILLMNNTRPLGNGCLLPAGSLREPAKGLERADVILLTGSSPEEQGREAFPPSLEPFLRGFPNIFHSYHRPLAIISGKEEPLPLDWLKGKNIYAFAGIGTPQSFRRTIESLGVCLTGFFAFPDHHVFTAEDIDAIRKEAGDLQAEIILTTEKDGVRLRDFPDFLKEVFRLRIEMTIMDRGDDFRRLIMQRLASL